MQGATEAAMHRPGGPSGESAQAQAQGRAQAITAGIAQALSLQDEQKSAQEGGEGASNVSLSQTG